MQTTRNDMAVLHALRAMEAKISEMRVEDSEARDVIELSQTMRQTIATMEETMADPVSASADRLHDLLSRAWLAFDDEEESVKEEHADLIQEMSDLLDELSPPASLEPPKTHEYLFDVKLFAAIRVTATSEAEARQLLKDYVDGTEANLGSWPNGDPILCGVSLDDLESDALLEIDGEAV